MEMDAGDAGGRLAWQAGPVEIVDVAVLRVEQSTLGPGARIGRRVPDFRKLVLQESHA